LTPPGRGDASLRIFARSGREGGRRPRRRSALQM